MERIAETRRGRWVGQRDISRASLCFLSESRSRAPISEIILKETEKLDLRIDKYSMEWRCPERIART